MERHKFQARRVHLLNAAVVFGSPVLAKANSAAVIFCDSSRL
jgi:hypothetical protein